MEHATWNTLSELQHLVDADALSHEKPILLFKHSTRCSISGVAKSRLESGNVFSILPCYYLDLIRYRELSAAIAERYQVHHESPQVLVLHRGVCVYDASHMEITVAEIKEVVDSIAKQVVE